MLLIEKKWLQGYRKEYTMLEKGFRYLQQLGDGYVLATNDIVVKKLYTGYPYPQFDGLQEDLLYDFFCTHYKNWSVNYYIKSAKDNFISRLKKLFEDNDELTVEEVFYPSDKVEKFKFLQTIGNNSIFIGSYNPKLASIPDLVIHSKGDNCYLIVPNNKFTTKLSKLVDINERTEQTYRVLPAYRLPFTLNKIHLFSTNTNGDALLSIVEDFVNTWSVSVNKKIDASFVYDFSKHIFHVSNRYVNDYTDRDFLILYEKYATVVKSYLKERYLTILVKFPYDSRNLKFNMQKGLLGIMLTNKYDIDADLFNVNIIGKLSKGFVSYKDGVLWLDAKKLFTGEYAFCLNLLKTMNRYGDFKYKKRLEAIKAFDISDNTITKHLLMSAGNDNFFKTFYSYSFFDLKDFYEFNIFIDKVSVINSHIVVIQSDVLRDFYKEFKPNLNCTLDAFIEEHFDYYRYAGTLIGLVHTLDSLEVESYSWDDRRGLTLYYKTEV